MTIERDKIIDFLRTVAIFAIISAHCVFPEIYQELRIFDVPLLVFISGISFFISSTRNDEKYLDYVIKRFKKLIIPVWIFITFYIIFFMLLFNERFSLSTVVTSYGLTSGIGFVWIFRIMFVMAIINPFLKKMANTLTFVQSLLIIIVLLIVNELCFYLIHTNINAEKMQSLLYIFTSYNIGYAVISYAGMLWFKFGSKQKFIMFLYFSILFLCCFFILKFPSIQEYKYPPQTYYILYGATVTSGLLLFLSKIKLLKRHNYSLIVWISKKSMNIYLWHIFVLNLLNHLKLPVIFDNYMNYFILIMILSIVLTFVQEKIIQLFKDKFIVKL